MPSLAYITLEWLDQNPAADRAIRANLLDAIPAHQWSGPHFSELCVHCPSRVAPDVERRRGNALNIEIGAPMPRCLQRSPDGRGHAWLASGGDVLAYGRCDQRHCARAQSNS